MNRSLMCSQASLATLSTSGTHTVLSLQLLEVCALPWMQVHRNGVSCLYWLPATCKSWQEHGLVIQSLLASMATSLAWMPSRQPVDAALKLDQDCVPEGVNSETRSWGCPEVVEPGKLPMNKVESIKCVGIVPRLCCDLNLSADGSPKLTSRGQSVADSSPDSVHCAFNLLM